MYCLRKKLENISFRWEYALSKVFFFFTFGRTSVKRNGWLVYRFTGHVYYYRALNVSQLKRYVSERVREWEREKKNVSAFGITKSTFTQFYSRFFDWAHPTAYSVVTFAEVGLVEKITACALLSFNRETLNGNLLF